MICCHNHLVLLFLYVLSFCGDIIQLNFLRQTAASRCEGFPTFREVNPFPPSECADGLVARKVLARCSILPSNSTEFDTQSAVLVLPNHQHILKMGTELLLETSETLHTFKRLSARETFIELLFLIYFCMTLFWRTSGNNDSVTLVVSNSEFSTFTWILWPFTSKHWRQRKQKEMDLLVWFDFTTQEK